MEGKTLALAVGASGLVVVLLGTMLLYAGEPPPAPEPPRPPPPPEVTMNSVLKYSQPVYRALLETDAHSYKVPIPSIADLGQPNPYSLELGGRRKLKLKKAGTYKLVASWDGDANGTGSTTKFKVKVVKPKK